MDLNLKSRLGWEKDMAAAAQNLIFSNIETIPGMTITQSLGVVSGSTVRAKNVFKDIGAAFKNIAGGEIKAYTELLQESRNEALFRMLQDASARGANAVVNVRFATSSVAGGAAELLAYGTAVVAQ
ncbi:MAG TPA: YbjQ family protein [Candidatus Thalassarchaeaceae archaeon]|jgi:uncharacterized protein YbjQ (UPF0145 family)|nr:YbjQ family protein [Candidatus Thalassarchaeaceae archaeon]